MLILGVVAAGCGGYVLYKGVQGQVKTYRQGCGCMMPVGGGPIDRAIYEQCLADCASAPPATYTEANYGLVWGGIGLLSGGALLILRGILQR